MAKGVVNIPRYREVCLAANRRDLEALAAVEIPDDSVQQMRRLAKPVRRKNRRYRGLNPACGDDVELISAVMRGEHAIRGFCNRDIRKVLYGSTRKTHQRRHSDKVSRLLKLLHVHQLIAKVPRSRRWRVTKQGQRLMTIIIKTHHEQYKNTIII